MSEHDKPHSRDTRPATKSHKGSKDAASDDVKSYYGLDTAKKKKERTKTIAIVVAIAVMIGLTVFLLVRPAVKGWNEDVDARINPPGQSDGSLKPGYTAPPSGNGGGGRDDDFRDDKRDGDSSTSKPKSPQTAQDLNLPYTSTGDWSDVVNPVDRITSDKKMVSHIAGLIASAREELRGVELDPANPDSRLQNVANYYFFGNKQAVAGLVEANKGHYKETKDSLHVFDHDSEGIFTFTYLLEKPDGKPGFLMAGWYDPATDSLKIHTASQAV